MRGLAQNPEENSLKREYWLGDIDLRPAALFRIALGAFVLFDLLEFTPNLRAWFSDEGVFPRASFIANWARTTRFVPMDAFGSPLLVWVYWGLAFVFAAMMLVGYRSRLASFLTFVLMAGFQERLPPLFDGSDSVLRLMLFWNAFTRSGNLWSVDSLRAAAAGSPLPRKGPALPVRLLQLQPGWIYLCSIIFKMEGSFWRNGTALHYVLHLDKVFTQPYLAFLGDIKPLVYIGSYGTLVVEGSFLALTLCPFYPRITRIIAMLEGTALHAGIGLSMRIGHFSYLMPLCYIPLFAPEWAQTIVSWASAKLVTPEWRTRWTELALKLPGPRVPSPGWIPRQTATAALATVFVLTSWYSLPALPPNLQKYTPKPVTAFLTTLVDYASLWNSWDMFAPEPLHTDYHLTAPGELENGVKINIFGGPDGEQRGFFFTRWWKYEENVIGGNQTLPLEWGRYVCREHNFHLAPGEPRLHTFQLVKEWQDIPELGKPWPALQRTTIWSHVCYEDPKPGTVAPKAQEKPLAISLPAH